MQRGVALATVAGVIVFSSLLAGVALPRYDCPGNLILLPEPERWPQNNDFTCVPLVQEGTLWAYEASDRLFFKIGLVLGGAVLGGTIFIVSRKRRAGPPAITRFGG
ncbi:MAG: hypothetical protein ACR2L4_02955 [Actinomycetota bacterium]